MEQHSADRMQRVARFVAMNESASAVPTGGLLSEFDGASQASPPFNGTRWAGTVAQLLRARIGLIQLHRLSRSFGGRM
jgi:hypothetical protein